MKLLHITGTHVISEDTLAHVSELNQSLSTSGVQITVPPNGEYELASLTDALESSPRERHTYDCIVVSGDLTSFGDRSSLDSAAALLDQLRKCALKPETKSNVIAIPGYRDVTLYSLLRLIEAKNEGFYIRQALSGNSDLSLKENTIELISKFASGLGAGEKTDVKNYLETIFKRTLEKRDIVCSCELSSKISLGIAPSSEGLTVNLISLNTLPYAFRPDFNYDVLRAEVKNAALRRSDNPVDTLNIAATYQGICGHLMEPSLLDSAGSINLPNAIEQALSRPLTGGILGRIIQEAGIDIHLHGRSSFNTITRIDFELGEHGSIVSAGSPPLNPTNSREERGYNVIEVHDLYSATIDARSYRRGAHRFWSEKSVLPLERNKISPETTFAVSEIRKIFVTKGPATAELAGSIFPDIGAFVETCDQLLLKSTMNVFVFGVRLERLRKKLRHLARVETAALRNRIVDGNGLKLLIVAPLSESSWPYQKEREELNTTIRSDISYLDAYIGMMEKRWRDCIEQLSVDLAAHPEEIAKKLDIRATSTPISHAGHVEYRAANDFKRALIHAIQVVDSYDTEVFLELSRRTSKGLLEYYAGSAYNLFDDSTHVLDLGV